MSSERRRNSRVAWNMPATIYLVQGPRPCVVTDLSNGGAKISGIRPTAIPDEFVLNLAPGGTLLPRTCRVVWRTNNALGVEFTYLRRPAAPARAAFGAAC
jgi:hypothetical protein